ELSELDWNGPELEYIVKWRQLTEGREWKELVVETSPYTVNNTPTFTPYQIQVQASNQFGVGPKPRTIIGYSGEDYPLVNPDRVAVLNESSSSVRVTWSPVPADSLRGHLRGYNVGVSSVHRARRPLAGYRARPRDP
ncbi:hypothetical protein chiPu_0027052, partial [Chiloscyllium punctatum]|nr:hypothetical protein [Chiloscyllium punctatum]